MKTKDDKKIEENCNQKFQPKTDHRKKAENAKTKKFNDL